MFESAVSKVSLRWIAAVVVVLALVGCKRKPPPDPHIAEGYRLVATEPKKALAEFQRVKDPGQAVVLFGQGLAYEALYEYAKAEAALEKALRLKYEPRVELALVRVRTMLGKLDAARQGIDRVVAKAPGNINALLMETCLARDDARTKAALQHLDAWPKKRTDAGASQSTPAEYHLARATLLARLADPEKAKSAQAEAEKANLLDDGNALALASVAGKAGQRGFAALLLARVVDKVRNPELLRRAAGLSYGLGAHTLTAKALGLLPADDKSLLVLRALNAAALQQTGAAKSLQAALVVSKDPEEETTLRLLLAQAWLREGNRAEATRALNTVLETQPKHVGARLQLAKIELAEGKATEAVGRLQAVATPGAPVTAHELLGIAYLQARQVDKAREQFEKVLELAPGNRTALAHLVRLDVRAKQQQSAIDRVARQIKAAPKNAALRLTMAGVLLQLSKKKEAEAVLREATAALPDEVPLWAALVRMQEQRKAYDEALRTLQDAEHKNPQSIPVAAEFAAFYTRTGRNEAALPYYERVLRFSQNDPIVLNNTAMLYADQTGDAVKAVELAEKARRLAPTSPAITDTLAWALYKRGQKGDAEHARALLESVRDKNTGASSKYHLGMVLIACDSAEAGKQLLRDALALPGEFPEAELARKALEAAEAGRATGAGPQ
ncbi:MAG: tetratricopeptide repeat protein [Polyangiaceae bacterium]|nr:tetratricopeptide repeat protein [Polyangiaceae bacterium]